MKQNSNLASIPPQSPDPILCTLPAAWGWRFRGKGKDYLKYFGHMCVQNCFWLGVWGKGMELLSHCVRTFGENCFWGHGLENSTEHHFFGKTATIYCSPPHLNLFVVTFEPFARDIWKFLNGVPGELQFQRATPSIQSDGRRNEAKPTNTWHHQVPLVLVNFTREVSARELGVRFIPDAMPHPAARPGTWSSVYTIQGAQF